MKNMPKYDTEEGYVGDEPDGGDDPDPGVRVTIHALAIEHEKPTGDKEKYRFGFENGHIVAIRREKQPVAYDSYSPSGLVEWGDVPTEVRNALQEELPQAQLHHAINLDAIEGAASGGH